MTAGVPILAGRDLSLPVAWRAGRPITGARLLAQALTLAERLPAGGQPLNLCSDRYRFALGTLAAVLRGACSLMPPDTLTATLRQLRDGGEGRYVLTDDPQLDPAGLPVVLVQDDGFGDGSHGPTARSAPLAGVPAPVDLDRDAVCLLTSGSTGMPQPHVKTWGALQINIAGEAGRLADLLGWRSIAGLGIVATVPAQHSYGFESSVLLALLEGAAFDVARPFYPADIADALQRMPRPRALVTTPFHLKTLLAAGVALPPVDLVLSATAPLSPQLAQQAEKAMGGRLIEIYGCTEAGQVAARRTTDGELWHTMGELRLSQQTTPDGELTVVQGGHVRVPTVLGDVIELLDPCTFRLLGRANDVIHVAGKRTSLAHLNFQLNRIEGVVDGAFWLPDDVIGGVVRPVAFVVAPHLEAQAIVAALRAHLEPAFVPRRVVHVHALPRAATGKLTAAEWRRFALETLGDDAA